MKILGINWGRTNGQNHGNLVKVLSAAAAAGAETRLIDATRLYLAPAQPEAPAAAAQDDFRSLLEEVLACDSLVVSCPVYALTPVGQYKSFVDRLAEEYQVESGAAWGRAPLGPKYISYISLGGARDHHWVSLCLPIMKMLGAVLGCQEIDEMDVHGRPSDPAGLKRMGEALVSAVAKQDGSYRGSHGGVCPVCHCDFVTILSGTDVICPVCGTKGQMIFEEESVRISF